MTVILPFEPFPESFQKHPMEIDLTQACVGELNTVPRGDIHWPILYGVGVNIKTGEIFPATFTDKGPDQPLRHARNFTGGQTVSKCTAQPNRQHKCTALQPCSICGLARMNSSTPTNVNLVLFSQSPTNYYMTDNLFAYLPFAIYAHNTVFISVCQCAASNLSHCNCTQSVN